MAIARPSKVSPTFATIAPLFAMMVPFMCVPAPKLTAPSTFQNTLQANAPLISFTFALAVLENAPEI